MPCGLSTRPARASARFDSGGDQVEGERCAGAGDSVFRDGRRCRRVCRPDRGSRRFQRRRTKRGRDRAWQARRSSGGKALYARLGDPDRFVAWSIRKAIRNLGAWDETEIAKALLDPPRQDSVLNLCDEAWSMAAIKALAATLRSVREPAFCARITSCLAGQYLKYPAWSGAWFGTNPLAGGAAGEDGRVGSGGHGGGGSGARGRCR